MWGEGKYMKTVKLIIGTIAGLYALAALIVFTLNLYTGRLHFNSSDAFSIAAAQIACFFIPLTIAILCFSKNGFRPEVKEVSSSSSFGKVISIVQIFICYLPILGLLVSSFSLAINRKISGWSKIMSWIGFIISIIITLLMLVSIVLALTIKQ